MLFVTGIIAPYYWERIGMTIKDAAAVLNLWQDLYGSARILK